MELISEYDELLRSPTRQIEPNEIAGLKPLINDMYSFITKNNGVGLAAPQIGLDINLFVMEWENIRRTCINSVILDTSDEIVEANEGCLSFPNLKLSIRRPKWITAGWIDENNQAVKATLFDMDARIFLHEWDHCQGILFTDRVGKVALHMARAKAKKLSRRIK